jgi:NADPH:quinone reductase-like Zn-dependent oxidoreductase
MKAVVYDSYGGPEVLRLAALPVPEPARGQLVVRVRAAALNPKDVLVRKGKYRFFSGRRFPQRVGYDWAGEVHAVGRGVSGARAGDRLYGMIQSWEAGAFAEYARVLPEECAPMPAGLSFEEAAGIPLVGLTALQALRDVAGLKPGQRVCVNGGSGGVGTVAIQVARALGGRVTSISSGGNLELCRELGAEEALDYARDELFAAGRGFDVLLDVFGNRSLSEVRPALAPSAVYVSTLPSRRVLLALACTLLARQKSRLVVVRSRRPDLEQLTRWVDEGRLRPVVDRVLPLEQVREAAQYLETKRARGKVVLRID